MNNCYNFDIPTTESLFQGGSEHYVYNGKYRVDFSKIPNNQTKILNLLPLNSPFYKNADFNTTYFNTVSIITKKAEQMINRTFIPFSYKRQAHFERYNEYKKIEPNTEFVLNKVFSLGFGFIEKKTQKTWEDYEVLYNIYSIPPLYTDNCSKSVIAINQLFWTALFLIQTGNIIPRILHISEGDGFIIKWFAATGDETVWKILEDLKHLIPNDFIIDWFQYVTLKNPVEIILSEFIGILIDQMELKTEDKILNFFFAHKAELFGRKDDKTKPYEIKIWTDNLFLNTLNYKYIVIINEESTEQFSIEIAVSIDQEIVSLLHIAQKKKYQPIRKAVFDNFEFFATYISNKKFDVTEKMLLSFEQLSSFLNINAKILKQIGIEVLLSKTMQGFVRPKLSLNIKALSDNIQPHIRLEDLLNFDWRIALGDKIISYEKFLELTQKAECLIKIKNNYIYIDEADIEHINNVMTGKYKINSPRILQSAILGTTLENDYVVLDDTAQNLISKLKNENEFPIPDSINAKLRPYQIRGFNWLYRNSCLGFGSILADDMGLGKTLQTITFIQKLKEEQKLLDKKVLIIAPTGLIYNWQSEIERFATKLTSFIYYGQKRNLNQFHSDILISTYGILRTDFEQFNTINWAVMVLDEAQNIKNRDTTQAKAAYYICADIHIALTGTPVENNLSELWSIMNFVNRGYFGSFRQFAEKFAIPIQKLNDNVRAEKLKIISAPFILRRLKSDKNIITDLPDKIERNTYIQLTENQVALYDCVVKEALDMIENLNIDDNDTPFIRQGKVLQMVLSLKQICNHPALYFKNKDYNPLLSGKTELLLSLLKTIIENNQKVLIFTQFKQMGDILNDLIIKELTCKPLFLHGGCNIEERRDMVQKFQNDNAVNIFILSLKAAGTGLNLTAANHVIHFDLWWNPAVEAQATDRAYRIGQHQNVIVHRFITQNTFEEKIDNIIQQKKILANLTVATGESWISRFSNEELKELFKY